jgi:hypothetical protein
MGLFEKFFTERPDGSTATYVPQDEAEACLAILYLLSTADGVSSVQEVENLLGNLTVKRRFFGIQWQETMKRIVTSTADTDPMVMLESACVAVSLDFRPTIFALAADLMLIDDEIDATERELLDHIGGKLGLPEAFAQQIVEVLILKNFDNMKLE